MEFKPSGEIKPVGSYPQTGIDVLIVGAGIGGMAAAIECVRKGHTVQILEKSPTFQSNGDMFSLGLSATKFFKHWPEMFEEYKDIALLNCWIETFKHDGTQMVPPSKVADRLKDKRLDAAPTCLQVRPLVYAMFSRQVEKLGIKVQYGTNVVDFFEDPGRGKAGAVTEHGERFEADVVIASDGVGSKSQRIVGGEVRAKSSGRAIWRCAFPIERLDESPKVKEFFKLAVDENGKQQPIVRTFFAPGSYAMVLTREDRVIFIMNHNVTGSDSESWHNYIEADEVIENMDKQVPTPWSPMMKELIKIIPPKTIVNFELLWRNPQPSWTSPDARVVQIGDAAHTYLPASGNGATQAVEDAVSLATCLQLGGKENIPQSVRAHVRLRFTRIACTQKIGFSNAELFQSTDWSKVQINPRRAQPMIPMWVWKHDPEPYTYENYGKVVENIKKGVPFGEDGNVAPNYPVGYKYEPWSIDDIMEQVRSGREIDLGPGDWDEV